MFGQSFPVRCRIHLCRNDYFVRNSTVQVPIQIRTIPSILCPPLMDPQRRQDKLSYSLKLKIVVRENIERPTLVKTFVVSIVFNWSAEQYINRLQIERRSKSSMLTRYRARRYYVRIRFLVNLPKTLLLSILFGVFFFDNHVW